MNVKFEDKSKSWKITYGKRNPVTGKYENTSWKGYPTKAAAERAYKDIVLYVEDRIRRKVIPTWECLIDSYLKACEAKGLAKKTIYNADKNLRAATKRWNGRLVDSITTDEIRNLVVVTYADSSESHRKAILKFIRLAFEHAVENDFVTRNPAPQLKFKIGKKLKSVLTYEQVKTLLAKAKAHSWEWYPHVLVALFTGMRSGELYSLTWDKVDFEVNHIKVDRSWNNKDGFKSTKSGDDRIVDMAPELSTFLKALKLQSGHSSFVLPRIGRWDKGEQARELRNFLTAIGLPPVRFHDLRATWATLLLSRGVEPVKVMAMGGWRNMDTMMRYIREAGIDIRNCAAVLKMHDSAATTGQVLMLHAQQS